MLHVVYEGTPTGHIKVQPFNPASPIFWEAGAIGMLDALGQGTVSDGSTGAYGVLYDRRGSTLGISNATWLPAGPASGFGDESLYNQPGHGNSLYGKTGTANNLIPQGTISATLLNDQTQASGKVTMYTRGGVYTTDQFDATQTYLPGQKLYVMQDNTGRLTNVAPGSNPILVGNVEQPTDGMGFLRWKSLL